MWTKPPGFPSDTTSQFRLLNHRPQAAWSGLIGAFALIYCQCLAVAQTPTVAEELRQGAEALHQGRLEDAAEAFTSVTKSSPQFAEAHFNLGLVREEQGRNEEAMASLRKAISLKPRLRGANLFLAIAEYRVNHFDKAIAALQKETSYYSSDANAWMWLGVVQLAAENPAEAAAALDKAARLAPDNVDILYHRGRAHLLVSKNSYEKMFQVDPHSWRVHQVLAQADAEADRHEDAIAEYHAAIQIAPKQPGLHEEKSGWPRDIRRLRPRGDQYHAAIQIAPKQPGLHEELGTEYIKAGKPELADAEFQQELEIDPNNVLTRYKLGTLETERGQGAKAKELIEGAVRQNPGLKDSAYYLGRAEMELGNGEAAAEAFNRAISAPDTDPEIVQQAWYQLGVVYRRLHRVEDAQKAFATFQRLKDEETQRMQGRLKKKREASGQSAAPSSAPRNPQ